MIEVLTYDAVTQYDLVGFEFINNNAGSNENDATFLCYSENGKLMGLLRFIITQTPEQSSAWFSYIEVLPAFRKKGVAGQLIKYLFIYCRSNRIMTISVSHFTAQGLVAIRHTLERVAQTSKITLIMDAKRG